MPRAQYGTDVDEFLEWLATECGRATKGPVYRLYYEIATRNVIARPLISTRTYDSGIVGPLTNNDIARIKEFAETHDIPTQKVRRYVWDSTQPP